MSQQKHVVRQFNSGGFADGRTLSRQTHRGIRCVEALLLVAIMGFAIATSAVAAPPKHHAKQGAPPAIDPNAMEALKAMGTYLRTLQAYQVQAVLSTDDVTDDGQIISSSSTVDLLADKPNHFRMKVAGDDIDRLYLYDGKNLTIWASQNNYYATVPAPSTISELVDKMADHYGIEFPLVDLFRWGTDASTIARIEKAADVGASAVDGVSCEQYIFHQDGIDWQIWIQLGQYPLPRKLVIRTLSDAARPQHSEVLTWNLAPSFNVAAFDFEAPAGAQKIPIEETNPASKGKN